VQYSASVLKTITEYANLELFLDLVKPPRPLFLTALVASPVKIAIVLIKDQFTPDLYSLFQNVPMPSAVLLHFPRLSMKRVAGTIPAAIRFLSDLYTNGAIAMLDASARRAFLSAGYPHGFIGSLEITLDEPEKNRELSQIISVQEMIPACKEWPLQVEAAMRRIEPDKWREAISFTVIKDEEMRDELRPSTILKRMRREPMPRVFFVNRIKSFDAKLRAAFLNLLRGSQKAASLVYVAPLVEPEQPWLALSDEGCSIVSQNVDVIKTAIPFVGIRKVTRVGPVVTLVADVEKGKGKTRSVDLKFKKEYVALLVHNLIVSSAGTFT
jgi:hypothetical protein